METTNILLLVIIALMIIGNPRIITALASAIVFTVVAGFWLAVAWFIFSLFN